MRTQMLVPMLIGSFVVAQHSDEACGWIRTGRGLWLDQGRDEDIDRREEKRRTRRQRCRRSETKKNVGALLLPPHEIRVDTHCTCCQDLTKYIWIIDNGQDR